MTGTKIRFVLFDWGGTLCDHTKELDLYPKCAEKAVGFCRHQNLPLPANAENSLLAFHLGRLNMSGHAPEYREYDSHRVMVEWLSQCGFADIPSDIIQSMVDAFWEPWIGKLPALPGTQEVLKELNNRGYVTALLSNTPAPPDAVAAHMTHSGFSEHMAFTECSSRLGVQKPNARLFRSAIGQARGILPDLAIDEMVYVGDIYERDIVGAKGIGMNAVRVSSNGNADPKADIVVRHVSELLDHLPGPRRKATYVRQQ